MTGRSRCRLAHKYGADVRFHGPRTETSLRCPLRSDSNASKQQTKTKKVNSKTHKQVALFLTLTQVPFPHNPSQQTGGSKGALVAAIKQENKDKRSLINTATAQLWSILEILSVRKQVPVVQRVDNAIHWMCHYPVDSGVCFVNTSPLYSDLSSG